MSKLACICGNVISDVHYPSPSDSILISEASLGEVLSFAGKLLTDLKKADGEGRRAEWIHRHFNSGYPQDATDPEILEDSLSRKLNDLAICVVKCTSCGRLHVQQKNGATEYSSYVPEAPR